MKSKITLEVQNAEMQKLVTKYCKAYTFPQQIIQVCTRTSRRAHVLSWAFLPDNAKKKQQNKKTHDVLTFSQTFIGNSAFNRLIETFSF